MNVPRGTPPVRTAFLSAWERDALEAGAMTAVRWPVVNTNTKLDAGTFPGLDFDSGRAHRNLIQLGGAVELRCRCRFTSGAVRVVRLSPTISAGDLFWVRDGDKAGARKESRFVLEVVSVDVARLQDMTDADAMTYGVALLPEKLRETGSPRLWYQRSRPMLWRANGWAWVVDFTVHRENIDVFLNVRPRVTVGP